MTVPNYGDILHIMLATKGYYTGKILGSKLATLLKNMLETNKTQKIHHLDYGLRTAKSVCETAGLIRRTDPTLDESLAIAVALYKTIGQRFPEKDRDALAGYFTTTFVGPNQQSKAVVQNYTNCRSICIIKSPWLTFWESKDQRHGILLLTDQDTFEFGNGLANWINGLQVQKCSAFAMVMGTNDEMYGNKNMAGPGAYESFLRKAAVEKDTMHFLIVAGYPAKNDYGHQFSAISFEGLNSLLDDNKMLHPYDDVRVPMPSNARVVFVGHHKVCDVLSPATVSRLAFVYY